MVSQICFGKLGLYDLCDLFRSMVLNIIHPSLKRVGKSLDKIRILVYETFPCAESSIGNIAAVFAERGDDIAFSFGFERSGTGFKLN